MARKRVDTRKVEKQTEKLFEFGGWFKENWVTIFYAFVTFALVMLGVVMCTSR